MIVLPIKFIKLMQDAGVGVMLRDQCNITTTEKLKLFILHNIRNNISMICIPP